MLNKKSLLILIVILLLGIANVATAQTLTGMAEMTGIGLIIPDASTYPVPYETTTFGFALDSYNSWVDITFSADKELATDVNAYGAVRVRTSYPGANTVEFKYMAWGVDFIAAFGDGMNLLIGSEYYNSPLFHLDNAAATIFTRLNMEMDTMVMNIGLVMERGADRWTNALTETANGVELNATNIARYKFEFDVNVDLDVASLIVDLEYRFYNTLGWDATYHSLGVDKAGKLFGKVELAVSLPDLMEISFAERIDFGMSTMSFLTNTYLQIDITAVPNMSASVYVLLMGGGNPDSWLESQFFAENEFDFYNFIVGVYVDYTLDLGFSVTIQACAEGDIASFLTTDTTDGGLNGGTDPYIVMVGAVLGLGNGGKMRVPIWIKITNQTAGDWAPFEVMVLDYFYAPISAYGSINPLATKIWFKIGFEIDMY
jgi:hypothetical protein